MGISLRTNEFGFRDDGIDYYRNKGNPVYYTHLEITGDPCNLIGSQQCDLFPNCTIFRSKSHPSFSPSKWK